jgi:hypothetical protein
MPARQADEILTRGAGIVRDSPRLEANPPLW